MNKKQLFGVCALLLVTSSSAMAIDTGWLCDIEPYLGANAEWRHMQYRSGFGNNLFPHHYPQANLYGGLRLTYVGIEGGYEWSGSRQRTSTLNAGELAAGTPIPPMAAPATFKSRATIKGGHLNLVGFYPICEPYGLEFMGGIGLAFLKANFERKTLMLNVVPSSKVRTMSEWKVVPRFFGGIQGMLTCQLGIRGTIGMEFTRRLQALPNDGQQARTFTAVKPQNSLIYSIGLFWVFK